MTVEHNIIDYKPFADAKYVDSKLIELAISIQNVIPQVTFKGGEAYNYNIPEECKPEGIYYSLDIYFDDDPNNRIRCLGRERYKDKYWITNRNIEGGRIHWGRGEGEAKQSKHSKNIVKIAKETLKPLTIKQVMDGCKREFEQNVNSMRHKWGWEINRRTNDAFKVAYEDMIHLKSIGYEPRTAKFRDAMNYLYENRANIDKYSNYDPEWVFVWVKPNSVEYMRKGAEESHRVHTLEDLPEDIRGKMFVLDISDPKQFMEDIGLKDSKTAYWVMP